MNLRALHERFHELQAYLNWTAEDAERVRAARPMLEPEFAALVDDFYAEILRNPKAAAVITGGERQLARLKGSLLGWLRELVAGSYDIDYAVRRWRVGHRHVEIGLDPCYAMAALSRLRSGLLRCLYAAWTADPAGLHATVTALVKLLDLDLTIIQDAYQAEYSTRLMQRAEARLASIGRLLEDSRNEIFVFSAVTLRFLEVNRGARDNLGYSLEQLRQMTPLDLTPEFTPASFAELLGPLRAGSKDRIHFTTHHRRADGTEYPVDVHLQLSSYEGQAAFVAFILDMTERRSAEERARQTERLAAIGQMVAGLAHESRNALQRSQSCLELLALELEGQPEVLDLVARIQKAQDHLHHLYEEVRGYAAPIKLHLQTCDLRDIWRETWSHLEVMRQNKVIRLRELAHVDRSCLVDRHAVSQVFRNIFENAIVACPEPGEIVVHCAASVLNGAPALRVSIRDNGPGLDEEQARRIFEPFFTTKTQGTGLGMAIASRIVDSHGGQIEVGHPPTGAEIIVTLPKGPA